MKVIPIVICALGTISKLLLNELESRKSEHYPNHSIIKIAQNSEKSSGDLRRLAATKNLVRNNQLTPA